LPSFESIEQLGHCAAFGRKNKEAPVTQPWNIQPLPAVELHEHYVTASICHPPPLGSAVSWALLPQCADDDGIFDD
jgi:hypothetical protein